MEDREAHIRIFPHTHDDDSSQDDLATWLVTALKARGGVYNLRWAASVANLPQGSVVLFRYGNLIIGEAIVVKYDRAVTNDGAISTEEWKSHVSFLSSSIRLLSPPLEIEKLQSIVSANIMGANVYHIIKDLAVYPKFLALHVESGGAFL
jgi:hypothetical protein